MNKVLSRYAMWDGWEFPKSCSTCKVFNSANDYLKKVPDGMQAKIAKPVVEFFDMSLKISKTVKTYRPVCWEDLK